MKQLEFKFMEKLNKEHSIFLVKQNLLKELEYYTEKVNLQSEFVEGEINGPDNYIIKFYNKKRLEIKKSIDEL